MSKSKHPLTPEETLNLKSVGDAQIASDGRSVAYVVSDAYTTDTASPKRQIWIVNSDGTAARQFTNGGRADFMPRWSPDGAWLAFLSDRAENGKAQVYLIPRRGGEARPLARTKGNVLDLQWSRDGKRIAFLMQDVETEDDKKKKEAKDDALEFEKRPKFARVWIADVATGALKQVTTGNVHVWEFDWSRDEREFALVVSASPSEYDWYRARLARVSVNGGEPKTLYAPQGNKQIALPRWSPSGESVAFISCLWSDRGVIAGDLWAYNVKAGEARNLTAASARDISFFHWSADGRAFFVMGFERGDAAIGMIDAASGTYHRWWISGLPAAPVELKNAKPAPRETTTEAAFMPRAWQQFSTTPARDLIATAREDPLNPPDVWTAKVGSDALEWRQMTRMNPQADALVIGAMRKIRWKSRDGKEIQGWLVKPVNFKEGARAPLVVWVHGGPASNSGPRYYALRHYAQLLAANGMMVLLPNPRGSVGWGTVWTEANLGDLGGKDWLDIMAGVDYCIAQGWADENRLGLAGWSYGGYLTAWGITQTKRFKAALVGAGWANWLSFHGTSNLAEWDRIANNASPYQRGGTYDKFTSLHLVNRIKTPTLILHGERDPYVPVGQAYELHRALRDLNVETELVVYPRELHGILEKNHQLDLAKRLVDWFKKRL